MQVGDKVGVKHNNEWGFIRTIVGTEVIVTVIGSGEFFYDVPSKLRCNRSDLIVLPKGIV